MIGRVEAGDIPTLQQLGFTDATLASCKKDKSALGASLHGGETEALKQLTAFVEELKGNIARSGEDNINSPAQDMSCKISPWLAMGCLSPREMYDRICQECRKVVQPASGQQAQHGDLIVCVDDKARQQCACGY